MSFPIREARSTDPAQDGARSRSASRRAFLGAAATVLFLPGVARSADGKKKPGKKGEAGATVSGAAGEELDAYLTDASRFAQGLSGAALVARDGRVLLRKGYGVADAGKATPIAADALFDWCSVTKQWTAAAILRLEMAKKLALDAPLPKLLKDVPKDKAKITLRHLLNHTSGLSGKAERPFSRAEAEDRDSLIRWVLGCEMASEPGETWAYSNAAYFLLAAIVEKVSGKTYEDYCREQVFAPAGLKDTWIIGDPKLPLDRVPLDDRGRGVKFAYGESLSWGYRGAGGIVAPVSELLAWDRALRGTKVLSEAAKKKYYEVGKNDYALGWDVKQNAGVVEYSHSGHTGKVITFYLRWLDPDVVVALALTEDPPQEHPQSTAAALATIARNAK